MLEFTKKGGSFKRKVAQIDEATVLLQDCQSNEELTVSRNQLKHFGPIETGMVLNAYCHADYNDSERIFLYPDRTCSEQVRKDVDDGAKMNIIQSITDFSQETLEKIALVISRGGNAEELAAAAGVSTWRPESSTLEYKSGYNPDAISEAIVAFFNSAGGSIYVGVSDSLETVGLEANGMTEDQMRRGIINHLRQTTSGAMVVNRIKITFDTVQGHMIAKIEVPSHQGMEVAYYKNSLVVRIDCTSNHLSPEEHTQWLLQRVKSTYIHTNKPLAI